MLIPILFAALVSAGCAAAGRKDPTLPDPQAPEVKPPEVMDREPDAGRVRFFENLTLEDFSQGLLDGPEKQAALAQIKRIMAGDDPLRVDPGRETGKVAALFQRGERNSYYRLAPLVSVTHQDILSYASEFRRQRLMDENPVEVVRQRFNIHTVRHPYAEITREISVKELDDFRGLPSFDKLAAILPENLPQINESRALKVLYPGAGSHVAPLLTALRLMDQGKIDRAQFIYTEIEAGRLPLLRNLLHQGVSRGVFDKLSIQRAKQFADDGSETTLEITYKGRPIQITFALNRSGKEYYREEYLRSTDLVILHDPGVGYLEDSFDLLAKILLNKKASNFADKDQMTIMEGTENIEELPYPRKCYRRFVTEEDMDCEGVERWSDDIRDKSFFPKGMRSIELAGPYGHCDGIDGVGEILYCKIPFARAFLLNDPLLAGIVEQHSDSAHQLSYELFNPRMRISAVRVGQ